MAFKRVPLWWYHWVNSIISGRSPPLYCTLTLIAMQGHQKNSKDKTVVVVCVTSSNNKDEPNTIIATRTEDHDDVIVVRYQCFAQEVDGSFLVLY